MFDSNANAVVDILDINITQNNMVDIILNALFLICILSIKLIIKTFVFKICNYKFC